MTSRVRIEWYGYNDGVLYGVSDLDVGAASVQSAAAPTFGSAAGIVGKGLAIISCVSGAVAVVAGANPTATDAAGSRVEAGKPFRLRVDGGQIVAAIASADSPAIGGQTTSSEASGAIVTHLVFQSVLAADPSRRGALIQNTSADLMYVFLGATGSATPANSLQLQPGQTFNCADNGLIVTDNIAMTSLAVDGATFVIVSH